MLIKHLHRFLSSVTMLELDFSQWEDGPPIQDDCSQAEGLAYSEAVRQLQEKSQRGLSKELVKQWGAHFKDKVNLEGLVQKTPEVCVRAVSAALPGGHSAFGGLILLAASPARYPNSGAQRSRDTRRG